jgi:hypothetical protein
MNEESNNPKGKAIKYNFNCFKFIKEKNLKL